MGKLRLVVPACNTGPELDATQNQDPGRLGFTFHLRAVTDRGALDLHFYPSQASVSRFRLIAPNNLVVNLDKNKTEILSPFKLKCTTYEGAMVGK